MLRLLKNFLKKFLLLKLLVNFIFMILMNLMAIQFKEIGDEKQ
jgi:hypothetical protein